MEENSTGELRKLPILRILDTDFYVDIFALEFRQVDDSKNTISFRDVQDNIDHTALMFDPKTKNAFKGTWGEMTSREDLVYVKLPAAVDLDRQGLVNHLNKMNLENYKNRQVEGREDSNGKPTHPKRGKGHRI